MAIFNIYVKLPEGTYDTYDLWSYDKWYVYISYECPPPKRVFMQGFEALLSPTPFW